MKTGERITQGGRTFQVDEWNGKRYYVCDICKRGAFVSLLDAALCCGEPLQRHEPQPYPYRVRFDAALTLSQA